MNPLIRETDLLVFDDAHGGEQFVSGMWTVSIRRRTDSALFHQVLQALSPAMTEAQVKAIFDDTAPIGVADQVDVRNFPECIPLLDDTLSQADGNIRFVWPTLRQHLDSCFFLVTAHEISIRPFIAPTHTHLPFADAKQRLYMSATMGDGGDILRAYGITKVEVLRSPNPQFGRRYVFVPGLYRSEADSYAALGAIWEGLSPKRAVLLSPSDRAVEDAFEEFTKVAGQTPLRGQQCVDKRISYPVHIDRQCSPDACQPLRWLGPAGRRLQVTDNGWFSSGCQSNGASSLRTLETKFILSAQREN